MSSSESTIWVLLLMELPPVNCDVYGLSHPEFSGGITSALRVQITIANQGLHPPNKLLGYRNDKHA